MPPTEETLNPYPDENPNDNEGDLYDIEPAPQGRVSPFDTGPVDPLIFRQNSDSPELRPAASYVSVGPQLNARAPKPQRPEERSYPKWTPGGVADIDPIDTDNASGGPTVILRKVALLVAVLTPLALVFAALLIATTGK